MNLDLTPRLRAAADYLEAHGWTQGAEKDDEGHVCLTAAIRYCAPVDGDTYLIRAVLRHRGRAEAWNDTDGRTEGDVLGYLRTTQVTDADLAETFGPQWEAIVALVRRSAVLTPDEVERLAATWNADPARAAARAAAWSAAWSAAWYAAWYAAGNAAGDAAGDAAGYAAGYAALYAAWDAALALVVRDALAPEHYKTLTGPWASVIGPAHPDDEVTR